MRSTTKTMMVIATTNMIKFMPIDCQHCQNYHILSRSYGTILNCHCLLLFVYLEDNFDIVTGRVNKDNNVDYVFVLFLKTKIEFLYIYTCI